MPNPKHARHAKPAYRPRHARRSQAPARVAAATAVGGLLFPVATSTAAYADERQAATVRVSGPGHPVQPGTAPIRMRLVSDGHNVVGQPVELQIPEGSGWRTVRTVRTGSDGLAHTALPVARDTRVRSYYRGSTATGPSTSSSVVLDVENTRQRILAEAARHRGAPYVYGATGPSAFDCSGFTRYVFAKVGKSLPHNASAQRRMAQPISRSAARPGDLIFLDNAGHVGIYAGNGMMWDSPRSGKTVSLRRIYSSAYAMGRVV